MANATVYFATNRLAQGPADDWQNYGAEIVPPGDAAQLTYAAAFVEGIDLAAEGSGAIAALDKVQQGGFDADLVADMTGSGKNLLVFIHGFANSFKDAITRAAFNREWFAVAGGAADTTILAFTWPSLGQLVAAPPNLLPDDYLTDQIQAGRSGFHVAAFLAAVQPLLAQVREQGRRVFLLAHSMGNFALQAAVENWFGQANPAVQLFDEVFLVAADERYDSFELPTGARLSRLPELSGRISVYYSLRDIAMYLSFLVNLITRLGHEGPEHAHDAARYPQSHFRILDCAEVGDYNLIVPPDASHQYYRRSPKVREDIAAAMNRDPNLRGGPIRL